MSDRHNLRVQSFLLLALVFFCFGIWQLLPFFTTESELVAIKGKLEYSQIQYVPVRKQSYNKAQLIFTLKGDKHYFRLQDEDGNGFASKIFDGIVRLRDTTVLYSVYIDEDDLDEQYPRIYQLNEGDKTILEFDHVRYSRVWTSLLLFGLAIVLFLKFYYS